MASRTFDVLVAGGGTGRDIVLAAEALGLTVALVEKGPLGGTCHNRGCMPSKLLIHSADVAETIKGSHAFGIKAGVEHVDFPTIVKNVYAELDAETQEREEHLRSLRNVAFYQMEGRFTGPKTMQVGGDEITADRVFIVGGTRPFVPNFKGLESVPHLTSDEALVLEAQPRRMIIVGGGYVTVELAHFFCSLGTEVTLIAREDRLLEREDREIAEWFTRDFSRKCEILLNTEVEEFSRNGDETEAKLKGSGKTIVTDQLLLAIGRKPNSDLWDIAATGVETNEPGFIKVNDYLETNVPGIWAIGDITGIMPLKHVAVRQARHVIRDVFYGERKAMDYSAIAHAVFSSPQVAAVGRTEEELKRDGVSYKVGRYYFKDTAMGMALKENGIVKVLAGGDGEILGCHIVGPSASILVHQAALAMSLGAKVKDVVDTVHVHPALPQVMEEAFKAVGRA